ncbi:hypothetical protein IAU60_006391 [Kwoniella sp. DSM 27419]
MPKPTEDNQALFQTITASAGFGSTLAPNLRITELDEVPQEDERGWRKVDGWKMWFETVVTEDMCNPLGALHGAASGWLLDTCTSAALIAVHTPTFWGMPDIGGVTLTMEVQCIKSARLGSELVIEVTIVKCSNRLSNSRCEIKDKATGKLISTGTHLKIWSGPDGKTAKL